MTFPNLYSEKMEDYNPINVLVTGSGTDTQQKQYEWPSRPDPIGLKL